MHFFTPWKHQKIRGVFDISKGYRNGILVQIRITCKEIRKKILLLSLMFNDILHCVKSVQIPSFFSSVFYCIWSQYGDLLSKSLYSGQMQQNMDQKISVFGHFSRSVEIKEVHKDEWAQCKLANFTHPFILLTYLLWHVLFTEQRSSHVQLLKSVIFRFNYCSI